MIRSEALDRAGRGQLAISEWAPRSSGLREGGIYTFGSYPFSGKGTSSSSFRKDRPGLETDLREAVDGPPSRIPGKGDRRSRPVSRGVRKPEARRKVSLHLQADTSLCVLGWGGCQDGPTSSIPRTRGWPAPGPAWMGGRLFSPDLVAELSEDSYTRDLRSWPLCAGSRGVFPWRHNSRSYAVGFLLGVWEESRAEGARLLPKNIYPLSPRPEGPWGEGIKGGGVILPLLTSPELRNS